MFPSLAVHFFLSFFFSFSYPWPADKWHSSPHGH
jgi:hypothetical protein